ELSAEIIDLMREAWVLTSLEYGAGRLRSGYLLAALLNDRNLGPRARSASAELARLPAERLQKEVRALVTGSAEDADEVGVADRTLDLALLQAGAGVKGEFENRLKSVIAEVKASPRPIILFVDEAHTLIGAGGSAGQGDAANLLKPALARGELRTIAATT